MARSRKRQSAPPVEEEEYEVGKVEDHRKTGKKLEYCVSWVGYGPEENTWLPEAELANCGALVRAYWNSKSSAPSKPSKAAPPSRGRKSSTTASANTSPPNSKRHKPNQDDAGQDAQHLSSEQSEDSDDAEDIEADNQKLQQYMAAASDWEDMVTEIVTVERLDDGSLKFFVVWHDAYRCWTAANLLYQRCPQRVINFFEKHLKFKKSGGS